MAAGRGQTQTYQNDSFPSALAPSVLIGGSDIGRIADVSGKAPQAAAANWTQKPESCCDNHHFLIEKCNQDFAESPVLGA
jgi:hypothetical protein